MHYMMINFPSSLYCWKVRAWCATLSDFRKGHIHQMPRHLVVRQIEQPVAARSRERRALGQPGLAPVLVDDRLQRMVGRYPRLPDAVDGTRLPASTAQPWLGPRHLAQQAVHRARFHCPMVMPYRQALLPCHGAKTGLASGIKHAEMAELFVFTEQPGRLRQTLPSGRLPVCGKWRSRRVAVQAGGTQRIVGGQEIWFLQQRGGAWLRDGWRRTDTHGGVKQALSLTIPRRQIGRWQWQDFIEVGEAAIGVETEGTIKYRITFAASLVNERH